MKFSRFFGPDAPLPNGYANLSVSFQGAFQDLIVDSGSVDQTGDYVFQVIPTGEAPTVSRTLCYWSVDGDSSTMISVWNFSDTLQDATLVLYFSGGHYRIPVHLDPRESLNLDTMSLVRSRVADADGNLIPPYITGGSATLVGPGGELAWMNLVASASVYNVRNATCAPICLDCGGITSVTVESVSVQVGKTTQDAAIIVSGSGEIFADSGLWLTNNPHIASVAQNGLVGGVSVGTTSITFTITAPPGGFQCFEDAWSICENEQFTASGTVTVTQ